MKIFERLKSLLVAKYLGRWIRHGLTSFSGFIVGVGVVVPPDVIQKFIDSGTEYILALLVFLIGIAGSYLESKKNR